MERERERKGKRKKGKVRCYEGLNLCVYLYYSSPVLREENGRMEGGVGAEVVMMNFIRWSDIS